MLLVAASGSVSADETSFSNTEIPAPESTGADGGSWLGSEPVVGSRNCAPGYAFVEGDCKPCPESTYSVDEKCISCLDYSGIICADCVNPFCLSMSELARRLSGLYSELTSR